MRISVVMSGRNYDRAEALPDSLELDDGCDVEEALRRLGELLPRGADLAPTCLVAVCGRHLGTVAACAPCELKDGDELVVIAPVAGG